MKIKRVCAALSAAVFLCGCSKNISDEQTSAATDEVTVTAAEIETEYEEAHENAVTEFTLESVTEAVAETISESVVAYNMPQEFYDRFYEIVEGYPHFLYYDISMAYYDVETGFVLLVNPEKHYYSASVMKAPYMLYIYRLALAGEADIEEKLVYTEKYRREGTGVLKNMEFGTEFTVEELIGYSLEESDNSAFAMLREAFSEEGYQEYIKSLGVTHEDDSKTKNQPQICAETALRFSRAIYDFIEEENQFSENLKYHMTHSRNAMIYGSDESEVVRKYGWYEGYFHDMAVVYDEKKYLLSIMTNLDLLEIDSREYGIFRDLSRLVAEYSDKLAEVGGSGDVMIINIPKQEGFEMTLPKDPYMLLSVVNMKLRDNYKDFDALCEDFDVSAEEITAVLEKLGYEYDKEINQFAAIPDEKPQD